MRIIESLREPQSELVARSLKRRRSSCMRNANAPQLVTAEVLAEVLDVPTWFVNMLFKTGRLPGYRLSARRVRFDVGECMEALRARPAESSQARVGHQVVAVASNDVVRVTPACEGR